MEATRATHRPSHVSLKLPVGRPTALRYCSPAVIRRGTCEATSFLPRAVHPGRFSRKKRGEQAIANWSPDGHKIVFSSAGINGGNIFFKLRLTGSRPWQPQVTTLPGSEGMFSPRWSPNGRFIAGLHIGAPGGLKVFDFETQRWSVLPENGECRLPHLVVE